MNDLVLSPITRRQFELFVESPAQVLLVSGPTGSGKLTLAKRLAETILQLPAESLDSYPQALIIRPSDSKAIGIDAARQLERFMRLKVPIGESNSAVYNRVVIVEDSHLMTTEAQNALLKTLEEPPAGSLIIMTVSHEPALLPTVRSRAQSLPVQRPDQASLKKFFTSRGFSEDEIAKTYALSGGLAGLMHALLADQEHPLRLATEQARQLLSQPLYERLSLADTLSKDKILAADTLAIIQRMARLSLQSASGQAARRWQAILEASYQTSEALTANAQPKLALTNLALQF